MLSKLGKEVLIFDGAIGTEISKYNLSWQVIPEELNITNPLIVQNIHKSYIDAGVDFLTTNTFGLNRLKVVNSPYKLEEMIIGAIQNASAVNSTSHIMYNIGPIGQLLSPLGTLEFDEAYEIFKEIVDISKKYVDGYIIETFASLHEIKACILAIKENSNLPVFATMTFDENGRTLTGATPKTMTAVLEGLGVEALGINCSMGPSAMMPIINGILNVAHIPVIAQPNRGLPTITNGCTTYNMPEDEFVDLMKEYVEMGVSVIGGCCGTNPSIISKISKLKNMPVKKPDNSYETIVCSETRLQTFEKTIICGERINPTAKKNIKKAIINENYQYIVLEAIKQEQSGAQIIDVNVGVPNIDETEVMKQTISAIQEITHMPLMIDSSKIETLSMAARIYNGIPLLNSVNGKKAVMDEVFPIVKKYGAIVVGLTLDDNGIPQTSEERYEIAKNIIENAKKYGIKKSQIIIDALVLTAASEKEQVVETLNAIKLIKEKLHVKTILGISNISYGLPNRSLLNKTFLSMAISYGLDVAIIDSCDIEIMNCMYASRALLSQDLSFENYLAHNLSLTPVVNEVKKNWTLKEAISLGLKQEVVEIVQKELKDNEPMYIIEKIIIPCLDEIGAKYSKGEIYLPTMIQVAESAKKAFDILNKEFKKDKPLKETIMLATVEGDIHDIGKNIVKTVLESYGYNVIDLGKDVKIKDIVISNDKYKPDIIGLSALMTTTVENMKKTIIDLRKNNCRAKIFVGGAVLTKQISMEIGADYYAKDALDFAMALEIIFKKG